MDHFVIWHYGKLTELMSLLDDDCLKTISILFEIAVT